MTACVIHCCIFAHIMITIHYLLFLGSPTIYCDYNTHFIIIFYYFLYNDSQWSFLHPGFVFYIFTRRMRIVLNILLKIIDLYNLDNTKHRPIFVLNLTQINVWKKYVTDKTYPNNFPG